MAIYRAPMDDGGPTVVEDYGQQQQLNSNNNNDGAATTTTSEHPQDVKDVKDVNNTNHPRRRSTISSIANNLVDPNAVSFMERPELRVLNQFRLVCGDIVNHPKVQLIIIVLIIVNAIMMGIATFDFVTENPAVDEAFEDTDLAFLIVFTIELGMQAVFRGYTLFMDGWLVFDFVIIVLSWSFASLQIIRAFRIFRALRIITRVETMRNLVTALFDIMPRLGAITALLLLIFYIFAVLFTQLFGDLELEGDYFSRLDYSFLTLFVMMTMEWADVARECMHEVWWAWAPFVTFIMITGFIVFNLIIAVVCDAVAVIESKEDLMGGEQNFSHSRGSKSMEEEGGSMGGYPGDGMSTYEEDLVNNLAERIATVLSSQKEMLATLEALTKDSLVPAQPPMKRNNSRGEEGGEETRLN